MTTIWKGLAPFKIPILITIPSNSTLTNTLGKSGDYNNAIFINQKIVSCEINI